MPFILFSFVHFFLHLHTHVPLPPPVSVWCRRNYPLNPPEIKVFLSFLAIAKIDFSGRDAGEFLRDGWGRLPDYLRSPSDAGVRSTFFRRGVPDRRIFAPEPSLANPFRRTADTLEAVSRTNGARQRQTVRTAWCVLYTYKVVQVQD